MRKEFIEYCKRQDTLAKIYLEKYSTYKARDYIRVSLWRYIIASAILKKKLSIVDFLHKNQFNIPLISFVIERSLGKEDVTDNIVLNTMGRLEYSLKELKLWKQMRILMVNKRRKRIVTWLSQQLQ